MDNSQGTVLLRAVDDLTDAKDLRALISTALAELPIDEHWLRWAVWSFVGTERRAGVSPALIILRLTGLVDACSIPASARLALTRSMILWCVEEYFGHVGADVLAGDSPCQAAGSPARP